MRDACELHFILLIFFKNFTDAMKKLISFHFQMLCITRYFAIYQKLSFGNLRKLIQPQMVNCVLVQEINKLFIGEVLLKSLMEKEVPTNINSLSNRIFSDLRKPFLAQKDFMTVDLGVIFSTLWLFRSKESACFFFFLK